MISILQQLIASMTALIALFSPPVLGAIKVAELSPAKNDFIIETSLARKKELTISDTHFQVVEGNGYKTEDNIDARNNLRGTLYTDSEYHQIKDEIVSLSREGEMRPDEEFAMWIELINKACAGKIIAGKIDQERFNSLIETDCK